MRSDRSVHPVVEDEHYDGEVVAHGGGQFLSAHQEVSVAGEGDHGRLRVQCFGAYSGGERIPHRPAWGAELGAVASEDVETLRPEREVPCSVGENGVGRKAFPQV